MNSIDRTIVVGWVVIISAVLGVVGLLVWIDRPSPPSAFKSIVVERVFVGSPTDVMVLTEDLKLVKYENYCHREFPFAKIIADVPAGDKPWIKLGISYSTEYLLEVHIHSPNDIEAGSHKRLKQPTVHYQEIE